MLQMASEPFAVSGENLGDALRKLGLANKGRVAIGLEESGAAGNPTAIHVSSEGLDIAGVLARICAQDGRYRLSEVLPGVIDLMPTGETPSCARC